jgi:hypothetical protein
MLLIDLINGIGGGQDEHRGGKWPEIKIVVWTQVWMIPPNLVWNSKRMGIAGKLRQQARSHREMAQEQTLRRHRLYTISRSHFKPGSTRLQILTKR